MSEMQRLPEYPAFQWSYLCSSFYMALCEHWIAQVPRWFLMNMTSFMILTCFFSTVLLFVFVSFLEVCFLSFFFWSLVRCWFPDCEPCQARRIYRRRKRRSHRCVLFCDPPEDRERWTKGASQLPYLRKNLRKDIEHLWIPQKTTILVHFSIPFLVVHSVDHAKQHQNCGVLHCSIFL